LNLKNDVLGVWVPYVKIKEGKGNGEPYTKAYTCPAGVYTAGFGFTGPDITKDTTMTKQQADERIRKTGEKLYENLIKKLDGAPTSVN